MIKQPAQFPRLSARHHFEFGYTRAGIFEPFTSRKSEDDLWTVQYGRCERMPLSFRSECLETARVIRASTDEPIVVLFSGGVDSEVVLRSFTEAGIEVRAAIMRFTDDANVHDHAWAVTTCQSLGVQYDFYDLDLLDFWKNAAFDYAEITQSVSPQLLPAMWLIDQIKGFCILGSGEHFISKKLPEKYSIDSDPYLRSHWSLIEKEKIAAWYRFYLARGRSGCPGFFQYTPEIMLSWILDPLAIELWNDRIPRKFSSSTSKFRIYRQHFDIKERPKYSGFERVIAQDIVIRDELYRRFPSSDWAHSTPIPRLIRDLSPVPERFPSPNIFSFFENRDWNIRFTNLSELPEVERILLQRVI